MKYVVMSEDTQKNLREMLDELGFKIVKNPSRPGASNRAEELISKLKTSIDELSSTDEFANLTVTGEQNVLNQTLEVDEGEYTLIAIKNVVHSSMIH
jgi:vacuolar-type H+-ATPase subunit I/STV1